VLRDLLDSLRGQGFRRILLVNGHGGNAPGAGVAADWMAANVDAQALFHNWWSAPGTWAAVERIDPESSHASWLENFPWTRLEGVELPAERKPMVDRGRLGVEDPDGVRRLLGDGSYGGVYARSDEEMVRVWQTGVEEVREVLEHGWR
jgi:creatinine amidohydrolase